MTGPRRAVSPVLAQAVMGTTIVSIALYLDRERALSLILMWIAIAVWCAWALSFAWSLLAQTGIQRRWIATPASLSAVAGTCVLGTRLTQEGWSWAGVALLALGAFLWLGLMPPVLHGWGGPSPGSGFLIAVSTLALSVLASTVSIDSDAPGLLPLSLALLVLGAISYPAIAARFRLAELLSAAGDHWIAGGAVAIAGLATAELADATQKLGDLEWIRGTLLTIGWVLWISAMAWLAVLILAEVIRPRLRAELSRWATVFPVGMYAAMSFALGRELDARAITDFARAWVWVALACWAVVCVMTASGALVRRP